MVVGFIGQLTAVAQLQQAVRAETCANAGLEQYGVAGQRCAGYHECIAARPDQTRLRAEVAAGVAPAEPAAQTQPALLLLRALDVGIGRRPTVDRSTLLSRSAPSSAAAPPASLKASVFTRTWGELRIRLCAQTVAAEAVPASMVINRWFPGGDKQAIRTKDRASISCPLSAGSGQREVPRPYRH